MSNEEQASRAPGSVPNAFGNALAWRWSRDMPRALKPGLLTLLYALRSMANAAGELKFSDGKPIRIQDIAKAAGADEKDTRDRLEAALLAGVVVVKGERRRGRPALYVIVLAPSPCWRAAAAYLAHVKQVREDAKRARAAQSGSVRKAAPWTEDDTDKFGGRTPELTEPMFGGPTPELTAGTENEVRGTDPRLSSGDRPPIGSGDRPPNNPGIAKELHQETAEVVGHPQVDGPPGTQELDPHEQQTADEPPPGWIRCARCGGHLIPRFGRDTHAHCQPLTEPERTPA